MKPFTTHTGLVLPLDRPNVDTDQMVPKQFLKGITREGFGRVLFNDWRYLENGQPNPDFILNQPRYAGASILLARENFGCGSSREHAPWAILDFGFRAIISTSYADIFYNNCFKNGLLPIRLPATHIDELFRRAEQRPGYRLTVNLEDQTISEPDPENGLRVGFEIDPFRKESLLKGLDEIGLSLQFEQQIAGYEKQHEPQAQRYGAL